MESPTPEDKLLEQLRKHTNGSKGTRPFEPLNVLAKSINAVAVDRRCSILATCFKHRFTILHWAADKDKIDVFGLVIDSVPVESKFDLLKVQNAKGNTPLHLMYWSVLSENIQHVLAGLSQENVAKLLQIQNHRAETLLHEASRAVTSSSLEYLLSLVKPEDRFDLLKVQDTDGRTTLYRSVIDKNDSENKIRSIMKALSGEEYFQLLQVQSVTGSTVLHKASESSSLSELKLLWEHKSLSLECKTHLFQLQNVIGDTLLHAACCYGSLEVAKYVVEECPPDVRLQLLKTTNKCMRNPLHWAVLRQHAILIEPLLAYLFPSEIAAILSMKDDEGNTALTSAVKRNAISVIQEITNLIPTDHAMSMLNITNNENKTAMDIAVGADNRSAVSLLQMCADRVKSLSTDDITWIPQPVHSQQDGSMGSNDSSSELMNASSSSGTSHHFLPNVLGQFNADNSLVQSGSKRAAPLETTTQPVHVAKTARVDHANAKGQTLKRMYQVEGYLLPFKPDNTLEQLAKQIQKATSSSCVVRKQEGIVKGHTLTMIHQGQGYVLPFKLDDTVEQLSKRIQRATSSSCVLEKQDGFKYTEDVTLDLVESPFVIVLGGFRILVTGDVQKRNAESSNSMTETRQSSTEQQAFGRVTTVQEVIELFSFVHERMKEGKTVNGALKLAKKSRKTIDRFMNIYYLHGQDREKMEELERNWVRDDKPQALPGLDKMAKKEINWNQLLKCFADGSVADFRLKKDR